MKKCIGLVVSSSEIDEDFLRVTSSTKSKESIPEAEKVQKYSLGRKPSSSIPEAEKVQKYSLGRKPSSKLMVGFKSSFGQREQRQYQLCKGYPRKIFDVSLKIKIL